MIVEVVFEGNPKSINWDKRAYLGELMNMFTPPAFGDVWIAIDQEGNVLDRNKAVGDQVADGGQRIYIARQAGTAA